MASPTSSCDRRRSSRSSTSAWADRSQPLARPASRSVCAHPSADPASAISGKPPVVRFDRSSLYYLLEM
eukprot:scaffold2507_cov122-Isochrysis_galbana.AAC.24